METYFSEKLTIAETVNVLRREGFDVTPNKLRQYEKEGLVSPEKDQKSHYRLYSSGDIKVVREILALLFLGYSIKRIRHFFEQGNKASEIFEKIHELKKEDEEITAKLSAIQKNNNGSTEGDEFKKLDKRSMELSATIAARVSSNKNYLCITGFIDSLKEIRMKIDKRKEMIDSIGKRLFYRSTLEGYESFLSGNFKNTFR